jgi:hypothetical protein
MQNFSRVNLPGTIALATIGSLLFFVLIIRMGL